MNRYRIVDRGTLQTVHIFAPDERSACVLAAIPVNRASIYILVWKDGQQTEERIELRAWEDHG
jgi:hypothetical protein